MVPCFRLTRTLACVISLGLAGCSSIRSTHVERDQETCGWKTRHLCGVPTKIKVPTHLEIKIYEKKYGSVNDDLVKYVENSSTFEVKTRIIEKEEIVTVDPVRPAAGFGYSKTVLTDVNSIQSIEGKVQDQTIEAIQYALMKTIFDTGTPPNARTNLPDSPSGLAAKTDTANLYEFTSLVAAQWFDLNDPQLETHIHEFMRDRLNACRLPCVPSPSTLRPHVYETAPLPAPPPAKTN